MSQYQQRKKIQANHLFNQDDQDMQGSSRRWLDIVWTLLVWKGIELTLIDMFSLYPISPYLSLAIIIYLILITSRKKRQRMTYFIVIISFILLLILFNRQILDGMIRIINALFMEIEKQKGLILPIYETNVAEDLGLLFLHIVWLYFSILMVTILYQLIINKQIVSMLTLLVLIYLLQILFHTYARDLFNVFLLILILFSLIRLGLVDPLRYPKKPVSNWRGSLLNLLLISGLLSLTFFFVVTFFPKDTYEKHKYVKFVHDQIEERVRSYRYGDLQSSGLTEGDLTKLHSFQVKDETALEVIMDQPSSIYLRGFVGARYTKDAWTQLANTQYFAHQDLFFWLREEGFHPLRQLAILDQLDETDQALSERVHVTVQHIKANRKYFYIPYELSSEINHYEEKYTSDYSMLVSSRLFGESVYHYEMTRDLVKKYPRLANFIYQHQEKESSQAYLTQESHYNKFAYQYYTDLPDYVADLLQSYIDLESSESLDHPAYEQAIEWIRSFLFHHLTYKVYPKALPAEQDFLTFVLEDSQEGFSSHFATLATLMFRYLGIPARYVEGYLITPEDIEGKEAYEKIEVSEARAHAWPEIYLDQVGWIPVEVTPPYYDVMAPTDLSDYPKGDQQPDKESASYMSSGAKNDSMKVRDQERDPDKLEETEEEKKFSWDLTQFLLLLFILMLLLFLIYILYKRYRLKKWQAKFQSENNNLAIQEIFAYILFLLRSDGMNQSVSSLYHYEEYITDKYGEEYGESFMKMIRLFQEAKYRNQEVTQRELASMEAVMQETIEKLVSSKSFLKKCKMKYIDGLY